MSSCAHATGCLTPHTETAARDLKLPETVNSESELNTHSVSTPIAQSSSPMPSFTVQLTDNKGNVVMEKEFPVSGTPLTEEFFRAAFFAPVLTPAHGVLMSFCCS